MSASLCAGSPKPNLNQDPLQRVLVQELARRKRGNEHYSLRAFARDLNLESSFVSKLVHGKRRVTPNLLARLAPALGLEPADVARLARCAKQGSMTKLEQGSVSLARQSEALEFEQLHTDSIMLVTEWYHFAILELWRVQGFKCEPTWIAKRLDIAPVEVIDALERLERCKLLGRTSDGRLCLKSGNNSTVGTRPTSQALRLLQKKNLELAARALDRVSVAERDHSTVTMAISKHKLGLAKERIQAFRRELCAFLEDTDTHDAVYNLTISLYPLTCDEQQVGP